jgi:hypothetical protein
MRTITSTTFTPKLDLSPATLEKYAVNGLGEACTPTLKKHGWTDGTAGGIIGIALGTDNLRVLSANLFLLGRVHPGLEDCTKRLAALYWPKAKPSIELRLPFDDIKAFRFDGTMQSNLVDGSVISHEFYDNENKVPLTDAEFASAGGGPFTLKAFCHMKDKLWCSLSISIFPKSKEELLTGFPYANDNNFPGLNLLTVDIKLMPNSPEDYGLAFIPLLQKGDKETPFPLAANFAIRSSVASLLQTGRTPKFARDITSLLNKWTKLEGLGDKAKDSLMAPTTQAKLWPNALPSPAQDLDDTGNNGMWFSFSR